MAFASHKILVFGANGQVGRALKKELGDSAYYSTRDDVDLSRPYEVTAWLEQLKSTPSAIINAAAYTAVDKAEVEDKLAMQINAETPAAMARYCQAQDIPFIHYSTDYVFPGTGKKPWKETDKTEPLNVYGKSKMLGEEQIKRIGGKWLIFRTSWVYDAEGKNFLNTMLRLGAERETLSVVNDQIGAPTFAGHIAKASIEILEKVRHSDVFPSGIYHLCNSGETSWHGFAEAIFRGAKHFEIPLKVKEVKPIPSSDYPTPAKRPLNSRLNCSKLESMFHIILPSWQEGLKCAMEEKYSKEKAA